MEAKIGQEVTITENFEIQTSFKEGKLSVKEGDKGFVDSYGFVHYETGEARGKIQKFNDVNVRGYDTENIAKLIYKHLQCRFDIEEFLEDYDYDKKDLIDEINFILSEIL